MPTVSIYRDVTDRIAYIFHSCYERLTTKGKCDKARRILIKASVDLSYIQPNTLTDLQKDQLTQGLTLYVVCHS